MLALTYEANERYQGITEPLHWKEPWIWPTPTTPLIVTNVHNAGPYSPHLNRSREMVFNQFFEHLYISLDSCDREKVCLNLCLSTNKYPTFKPLIHTINRNKPNSSAIRTPIKYLKMARSPWKNENTKVQVFRFPCVLWCRVPCILCPLPSACVQRVYSLLKMWPSECG